MKNVFKRNVLTDVPPDATIVHKAGERFARFDQDGRQVQRAVVATRKGDRIIVGQCDKWAGKIRLGPKSWKVVTLYTDKLASERRLLDLQREADRIDAGAIQRDIKFLQKPISELKAEYIDAMTRQRRRPAHIAITGNMLDRLIKLGGWRRFRDITKESVESIVDQILADKLTVSYCNGFIKKAKAFVHHFLPDGMVDPLKKLKRLNERGAKRNRARKAATADQFVALLTCDRVPEHRRLAYALGALNGLRRNEIVGLTWENVHLTATVPYLGVTQKQGVDDTRDYIPLHPYLVKLLAERVSMPAMSIVPAVPDVRTLESDWLKVGVDLTDDQGLRLDFHALRHTFETQLDQTACSRATKKRLMRHAHEDVTDGYAHAELAEMLTAIARIPSPDNPPVAALQMAVKTGTTDQPIEPAAAANVAESRTTAHHRAHHGPGAKRGSSGASDESTDHEGGSETEPSTAPNARQNRAIDAQRVPVVASDLNESGSGANVADVRAGYPSGVTGIPKKPRKSDLILGRAPNGAPNFGGSLVATDDELRAVIDAWPRLPEDVRRTIVGVVRLSTPKSQ